MKKLACNLKPGDWVRIPHTRRIKQLTSVLDGTSVIELEVDGGVLFQVRPHLSVEVFASEVEVLDQIRMDRILRLAGREP